MSIIYSINIYIYDPTETENYKGEWL